LVRALRYDVPNMDEFIGLGIIGKRRKKQT
jgi:hypothetical protein